jgi:hypothetical protein
MLENIIGAKDAEDPGHILENLDCVEYVSEIWL